MPAAFFQTAQFVRSHRFFEHAVLGLIALAGVLIGIEASFPEASQSHQWIRFTERLLLGLFTLELFIRYAAERFHLHRCLRGWNLFDTVIVALCYLPETGEFAVLVRLARILRLVRLLESIPRLRILLMGILRSLPSMGYIALLLGLLFYTYGVLGVFLFRGNDPGHFGHLGQAFTTLLRVVTLEDWTDVMYTALHGSDVYPAQGPIPMGPEPQAFGIWAVLYFASFVVLGAMVILNLFIGAVLTSLSEAHAEQFEKTLRSGSAQDERREIAESLTRPETELRQLRARLKNGSAGDVTKADPSPPA